MDEAKQLKHGDILHHVSQRNADGSPQKWRVNGAVKTWKRDPTRVRVPLKYGLRSCDYLTEHDLDCLELTPEKAMEERK